MSEGSNLEFRKIKSLQFLYEVNSNGTIFRNVKSKKQSRIVLDMHHSSVGYYFTWVNLKGKVKRVSIAHVVAECWLGDKPDGYEVDHRDRNSHNNDYRNLRYVTKSEQMKNRDHTNISARGSKNLEAARRERMKAVKLVGGGVEMVFESTKAAARYLADHCGRAAESMRARLRKHRSRILDFDVIYLNAETEHARSTEQETVH
ncbi:MAG: HNH endonuclease [Selenomonadaceae bacterium]|nr:HNH endonuclease [Selenomonadaceae bacterium]